MKTKSELQGLARKELMAAYKDIFGKGSRKKSSIIIEKILESYSPPKPEGVPKGMVKVRAQQALDKKFGTIRIVAEPGDILFVPERAYHILVSAYLSKCLPVPMVLVP